MSGDMYEVPRIAVELASVILCFVLVRYMIRPYLLTREQRYLGLPLGFAFIGISSIFVILAILEPLCPRFVIISVLIRTFGFVFLAITYYFSKKPAKNSQLLWNATLSLAIIGLAGLSITLTTPLLNMELIASFNIFLRILTLFFIAYICVHTLNNHTKKPNPTTIWIPLGFILFGISQYSFLISFVDLPYTTGAAFVGGLVARLLALAIFLYISYKSFHSTNKEKEEST